MNKLFTITLSIALLALAGCATYDMPTYETGPATTASLPTDNPDDEYLDATTTMALNVQQVDVLRLTYMKTLGYSGGRNGKVRLPERDECRVSLFKAGSANGLEEKKCGFSEDRVTYIDSLVLVIPYNGSNLQYELSAFPYHIVEGGYYEKGTTVWKTDRRKIISMPGSRRKQAHVIDIKIFVPKGMIPEGAFIKAKS